MKNDFFTVDKPCTSIIIESIYRETAIVRRFIIVIIMHWRAFTRVGDTRS